MRCVCNRRHIYECRCDERLKSKDEGSTRLGYTGFHGRLEHLKIETRLINERFVNVMGECDFEVIGESLIFNVIRSVADLVRMLPTFDLSCEEKENRVTCGCWSYRRSVPQPGLSSFENKTFSLS
jgi:hypothetical protein